MQMRFLSLFILYTHNVEKKQADCPFEERRRMRILQAPLPSGGFTAIEGLRPAP